MASINFNEYIRTVSARYPTIVSVHPWFNA